MKYRDPVVAGPLMSDMKFKKKTPRFRIEVGGGGRGRGVWIPTPSCGSFHYTFACRMTDTQESVVINQNTIGQILGFLWRLKKSCIESEWFIPSTIVAVLAVGCVGALFLCQTTSAMWQDLILTKKAIKSSETTLEKMLDKREQGSKAFIENAIKTFEARVETNMAGKFEELKRLLGR